MDKDGAFAWHSADMNGFLNLSWDHSPAPDHTATFESALSSLVSSPTSSAPTNDGVVIRELIGRLGSICSDYQPPSSSADNSCYNTPLNSPPKLNLFQLAPRGAAAAEANPFAGADPGFAERAARFSCFGAGGGSNYAPPQFGAQQEPGKLSRASSSQSLKTLTPTPMTEDVIMMMMMMRPSEQLAAGNAPKGQDESSASDHRVSSGSSEGNGNGGGNTNVKKRKAAPANKTTAAARSGKDSAAPANSPKVTGEDNSNSKRSKSATEAEADGEANGSDPVKTEQQNNNSEKQGKDNNAKPPEPPKQDYIHVRARRGQATDSHSLAERVRREKISERMKFLQDLVPGCNKVTGKAVMLDEIINYVQSLQRQVEFLSMKLATVNPRLDFNLDTLLSKEMHQPRGQLMLPQSSCPVESMTSGFAYGSQLATQGHGQGLQSLMATHGGLESQCSVANNLDRSLSMQLPPLHGFTDASVSQLGGFWEDDLQFVVQTGFAQPPAAMFSSHNFQGPQPASHMKIEP